MLTKLGLESLELRRLKSEWSYAYKILHSSVDINSSDFFSFHNSRTLGHDMELVMQWSRIDVCNFFSNRVILSWNSLNAQPADFSRV